MKTSVVTLVTILTWAQTNSLNAQLFTFGGADLDQIDAVRYDASGNVYYFGEFEGTTDFDPSDGPDAFDTFTATSTFDAGFVASYTGAGVFRWVVPLAGTDDLIARGLDIDPAGNVFISGEIEGTFDFDPGAGTQNRVGDNADDVFVASYSSAGAFRFAHVLQSTTADDGNSVAADAAGNVYFCGEFRATIDFDPGAGVQNRTPVGVKDGFVVSYDSSGAFRWVRQMGGNDDVAPLDIVSDASGNVFLTGQFGGDVDFDDSDGADANDSYTAVGNDDGFLASFTSAGAYRFGFPFGTTSLDFGGSISEDAGLVYLIGISSSGVDFDPGPGTSDPFGAGGARYLACYNTAGALQFAVSQGGSGNTFSTEVHAEGGDVYVTGRAQPTEVIVNLAPYDSQGRGLVATDGDSAGFLIRLESDGTPVWARTFGNDDTRVLDVVAAPGGGAQVVGYFDNAGDFDPGVGMASATSAGMDDALALILDEDGLFPGTSAPSFEITTTADNEAGSLRQAIEAANITPLSDTITVALPGARRHTISRASPLPATRCPRNIDALTQPGASTASWPPDLRVVLDGTSAGVGADGLDVAVSASSLISLADFDTEILIRGLVIGGFNGYGIDIASGIRDATITHCFIGTSANGLSAAPNGAGGIRDLGTGNPLLSGQPLKPHFIGLAGEGNLISGNTGHGITIGGEDIFIRDNWIGVAADGVTPLGNGGDGVRAGFEDQCIVGGTLPGEGNRIWFNGGAGVFLDDAEQTDVLGNSIKGNGTVGIDQDATGLPATPALAFSQIDSALNAGGMTIVEGTFDGMPGGRYRLEFFSNAAADPSGFGEGETFLGAMSVDTDLGDPSFRIEFTPAHTPGTFITATATEIRGAAASDSNTSEFSEAIPVTVPDVTTNADSGPGSLRAAITTANCSPGLDKIVLSPNLSGQTIALSSPLPMITGALTLRASPGTMLSGKDLHPGLVIDASGLEVTIENLIIEEGLATQGGGIRIVDGKVFLNKVTVRDCEATAEGGGLVMLDGELTAEDCRFSDNVAGTAGGGLAYFAGAFLPDRCTFDGNSAGTTGGGIYLDDVNLLSTLRPRLNNITLSGNMAATGGGLHNADASASPVIEFMTVTGNTATVAIGGVSGIVSMTKSVVAGNSPEVAPTLSSPGQAAENTFGGDPKLGPLRDNGGFIPTHAVLSDSPLRDASSNSGSGLDARRGPRNSPGGTVDHGAFEYSTGGWIEPARDFDAWDGVALPPGQNLPGQDPNLDGINNLLSHYLGVHPLRPGSRIPIDFDYYPLGMLRLTWSTPLYRTGSTAVVESASDLEAFGPGPAPVELGSSTARTFYEVVFPSVGPEEYGRLHVTQDP